MTTTARVLLADDSPHAQRMGERILREEGYEVVTVTDGETAIMRLKDVDPDVVIVDAFLPQVSGYDLCGFIKKQPQHSHVRVLLTSTALEKVDEDHAYKVGADGQLKKPFEASVMLKSLKDLIGGSEKTKKRAGTTLDLNGPMDEVPVSPERAESGADEEEGEKPVSALQAWLQQHDAGGYAGDEQPAEEEAGADTLPDLVSASVAGKAAAASVEAPELANPQLLRRAEEEPEDLSLRNNPVARLRYAPKPEPTPAPTRPRNVPPASEPADAGTDSLAARGGTRTSRVQSISQPANEPESGEAPRPPRKSLLEQLEEYERASALTEDPLAVDAPAAAPVDKVEVPEEPAQTSAADTLERAVEDMRRAHAAPAAAPVREEVASPETEEEVSSEADEDKGGDEDLILSRSRRSRLTRPSILEAVREREDTQEEEAEPEAEEVRPARVEAPAVAASVAAPAAVAAAERTVLSLATAGVRLDEEEMRAVVEIAVSAAMPTIVDEVSRCVLLALQSRYAEKALQNGDHSNA